MVQQWIQVVITRLGASLSGSPFTVKLRYRRLHIDPQIAPIAARRPVQEFLFFADITVPVAVGDIVTLPSGDLTKIIDVRAYPCSLQCLLQRLPYAALSVWTPCAPSAQIGSDKSLSDVGYVSAGTVLALFEPHGIDQAGPLPVGKIDRRTAFLYALTPLSVGTVVAESGGDYWLLTAATSYWALSADYRAPARRLTTAPPGVG